MRNAVDRRAVKTGFVPARAQSVPFNAPRSTEPAASVEALVIAERQMRATEHSPVPFMIDPFCTQWASTKMGSLPSLISRTPKHHKIGGGSTFRKARNFTHEYQIWVRPWSSGIGERRLDGFTILDEANADYGSWIPHATGHMPKYLPSRHNHLLKHVRLN